MKLLLIFAALLCARTAVAIEAPRQSVIDQARIMITNNLENDLRMQLAQYLPGVFPLHFLCQFKGETKPPFTVIPGNWVDAEEAGELHCPGLLDASLEKQSRLRVNQYGKLAALLLEKGRVTVKPTAEPFFLETKSIRLGIANAGKLLQMSALASDSSETIGCNRGAALAELEFDFPVPQKQYLFAHACRVELQRTKNETTHYLSSQDLVEVQNLALPRRTWPSLRNKVSNPFLMNPVIPLSISFLVKPGAKPLGQWAFPPALLTNASCTVYSQTEEGKPAKEAAKFESKELQQGEIELDAQFAGSFLSLVCEDAAGTFASTVVF